MPPWFSPDISVKLPSTQILSPLIEGLSIRYNINKTSTLSVELAGLLKVTKMVFYIAGVFEKLYENQLNLKLYIISCELIRFPVLHGMTILRSLVYKKAKSI